MNIKLLNYFIRLFIDRLIIDKTIDEYTFYTHLKLINVSKLDTLFYKCKGLLNGAQELQDYRWIEVNGNYLFQCLLLYLNLSFFILN